SSLLPYRSDAPVLAVALHGLVITPWASGKNAGRSPPGHVVSAEHGTMQIRRLMQQVGYPPFVPSTFIALTR
ncbi:MAG: hypothetical protein ACKPKO_64855, partial [Candidatus Fonsibacter sp.]